MALYKIVFTKTAQKDIQRLSQPIAKRVCQKITFFMGQPDPLAFAKRLHDSKAGTYRWRIGDYRIGFDIEGETIVVLRARHRREIYNLN